MDQIAEEPKQSVSKCTHTDTDTDTHTHTHPWQV